MSTSSPRARVRTFTDKIDKDGFLRAGGRLIRPVRTAATAGVASLAAAGALVLVAACGGAAAASGPVPVSLSRTTVPAHGAMTRVSRGPGQGEGFTEADDNWAGYVIAPGRDVDAVSGVWTVPTLNCRQTPNAQLGVWAGIGGVDEPLLQTGVGDGCSNGAQHDQAWWELANAHNPFYFSGLFVGPADQMQASVYLNQSGQWVTRIDNLTTGWSGWMVAGGTGRRAGRVRILHERGVRQRHFVRLREHRGMGGRGAGLFATGSAFLNDPRLRDGAVLWPPGRAAVVVPEPGRGLPGQLRRPGHGSPGPSDGDAFPGVVHRVTVAPASCYPPRRIITVLSLVTG